MTNVRLDGVTFSSFHETFRNRERLTGSAVLSGSIPGGSHKVFNTTLDIERNSAVYEIYHQILGFSRRRADASSVMLDVVWAHNVYIWVNSPSAKTLQISIDVDNPGAADTIITQTVNFVVYVFDTPFNG